MTLEDRLLERIGIEFAKTEQVTVVELLSSYAGREAERVRWDILKLSNGSLEKVRQYIEAARVGYRDFLYWTKYFDDDLMLRTWQPKKLVEQILAKCSAKAPKIA